MRVLIISLAVVASICTTAKHTSAQGAAAPLGPGARLRLRLRDGPVLDAYLVSAQRDTLFLDAGRSVPIAALSAAEQRTRERRGRGRWTLIGIVAGAVGGATWCAVERRDCMANSTDRNTFGEGLRAVTYGGALAGALAGFIVGTRYVDRWRPVPLSALGSALR